MKFAYALPALFLVAVACSDSVTDPSSKLVPAAAAAKTTGDPPPPPVDATVVLCVSTAGCTAASGSYFDNSASPTGVAAAAISAALTDGACTFPGPSWLRFKDATTTPVNGGPVESAKGRIQCSQMTATGQGTITIGDVTYELAPPFTFENTPDCTTFCASFTSNVTLNGVVVGTATGAAFERSFFEAQFCGIDESGVPFCQFGGID